MDLMFKTENVSIDKFNKCGELYRSPKINDKQYMFLSCIYCKDISWELKAFLKHLDNSHQSIDDIYFNLYKDEVIAENSLINENVKQSRIKYSSVKPTSSSSCENDPLDEKRYDYNALLPVTIKVEKSNTIDCKDVYTEKDILSKDLDHTNESFSDEEFEPDKDITEDENNGEYPNKEYEYDEDGNHNDDADNIAFNSSLDENKMKTSVRHLTKNRELIKAVINAYQKQYLLWDSAYKSIKSTAPEKQEALTMLLIEINEKFKISATLQQIELIIKRLKLRFKHHLQLKDKGESYKPLWFFKRLTFLEPHLNGNKLKSGICKQLSDDQFLSLIKLLKENECFWNENNIYHTSVKKKQEILNLIISTFSKVCDLKIVNVDIMQNTIDEIIEMAREENANKMQHVESDKNEEYQSSNRFYKEIKFLLPHVGPFKCKYCTKTFTDVYAYKFHISRHEGTKPFKCMECPRELTHKKEFVCHLRRHTKECPFQCTACDKSFPSQKEWHRHVIKHGSKPYVCELCADSFYTQHQLTNHMKNHNNIRDHVCTECGKGFTHRGLLRQHLQTHNKTKCFCTLCDNIYSNPRSLRKHYVRVHESGQQLSTASKAQYNCQICKITFSTTQDAKQHRKEHKQSNPAERRHVCDICGHHFAYPRNLADHKKTHSNIRDQVCDVCGKAFTNTNLLNQHKNVHTGEKFVCKACGKDYAHYRGLCRHITKVHGTNIRDLDALLEKEKVASSLQ